MKQSKAMSLTESTINILVGFGISLGAQLVFLPMLGVTISLSQNIYFALIMTVISIARSYLLRRLFEALHIRVPLSPAMLAIIAERRRQVDSEGWSVEHDDLHETGVLALAGAAYGEHAAKFHDAEDLGNRYALREAPKAWPWRLAHWNPQNFRRDLIKGAALYIAEIEKFDRSKPKRERKPAPDPVRVPPTISPNKSRTPA